MLTAERKKEIEQALTLPKSNPLRFSMLYGGGLGKISDWVGALGAVGWSDAEKAVLQERIAFATMTQKRKEGLDFIARALRLDIVPRSFRGYNLSFVGRITLVSLFMKKTLDVTWPGK